MDNLNCGNSKKNILLITPMLHQGGFERVCLTTARLLSKCYHVTVAVFSLEDLAFDITGLDVIDLQLKARDGFGGKLLNVCKRARKLKRLKKEKNIDVSYSFGPTANLANVLSRVNDQIWTGVRGFAALGNRRQMQFVCNRSDKVVCCSKVMASEMSKKYYAEEIVTLWNPCDIVQIQSQAAVSDFEFKDFFDTKDKIIVSMGREHDVKGFWHLLKSFALVHRELPNTRLVIVGDGDYLEYKILAEKLDISESTLFTGVQHNPFPYLKHADIYVLTSLNEGLPNALIEALSLKLSIVSIDCQSGPAEILCDDWENLQLQAKPVLSDYGVLIPNYSVEERQKNLHNTVTEKNDKLLADGIFKLLHSKEIMNNYEAKAELRAKLFSNETYEKQLRELIEGV